MGKVVMRRKKTWRATGKKAVAADRSRRDQRRNRLLRAPAAKQEPLGKKRGSRREERRVPRAGPSLAKKRKRPCTWRSKHFSMTVEES